MSLREVLRIGESEQAVYILWYVIYIYAKCFGYRGLITIKKQKINKLL
jgi:hypothetical protein